MARKPIPIFQQQTIKRLRASGKSAENIKEIMEQEQANNPDLPNAPALRTIANYFKKFPREDQDLDRPFEWHSLDSYDLPWEAGAFVLDMWRYVVETNDRYGKYFGFAWSAPTVRQVRWWWRVHLAVPGLESRSNDWDDDGVWRYDLWLLAEMFAVREFSEQVLGRKIDYGDLDALLAYTPWASDECREGYLMATTEGRAPALKRDEQFVLLHAVADELGQGNQTVENFMRVVGFPRDDAEELKLPTKGGSFLPPPPDTR